MKLSGYLYDHHGPRTLLYILLGYGILAFGLAILLDLVGAQLRGRFKTDKEDAHQGVSEPGTQEVTKSETKANGLSGVKV